MRLRNCDAPFVLWGPGWGGSSIDMVVGLSIAWRRSWTSR